MALNSTLADDIFSVSVGKDREMRTTIALDDELLEKAKFYTGISETAGVIREALKRLIEHEAARRLARLGGTMPDAKAAPRRRSKPA